MMTSNRTMLHNGGNYVLCKDGEYNNGKPYFAILANGSTDLIYKYKSSCSVDASPFPENKDIIIPVSSSDPFIIYRISISAISLY